MKIIDGEDEEQKNEQETGGSMPFRKYHDYPPSLILPYFEQLIQEIREQCALPLLRVVHLWSLDAPGMEELTASDLDRVQVSGCGSMLHTVQALAKSSASPMLRLWLVTRNAVPAGQEDTALAVAKGEVERAEQVLWRGVGLAHRMSMEPWVRNGLVLRPTSHRSLLKRRHLHSLSASQGRSS